MSAAQTFVFHHFDDVNECGTCACGKHNRDFFLSGKVHDVNTGSANETATSIIIANNKNNNRK